MSIIDTIFLNLKFIKLNKEVEISNVHNYINYYNELINVHSISALSAWYKQELNNIDNVINDIEANCKLKTSCTKGCSSCCKQAIYINPAEYEVLKYKLKKLNNSDKIRLKNYAKDICKQIKKMDIPLKLTDASVTEQIEINTKYFELNKSCPFLDSANSCSIYEIRPASCWAYRKYNKSNDCNLSCTPKYGYSYSTLDALVTERFYNNSKLHLRHNEYYIIPYALTKIL
ncbi:YkgJ family cysteine cluster protein [Lacrimispora sp. BS-2]|uniref:YkgJ family cysteine cluster protein n=1 Tax=Lacrimispora sp. BS-2 TaxID=3151850 RepID=A0AAU7PP84_9FIRM